MKIDKKILKLLIDKRNFIMFLKISWMISLRGKP